MIRMPCRWPSLRTPSGSLLSKRCYTRPSFAPKPNLDLKHIRLNPGLYEQNCNDRNYKRQSRNSWRILELHEQWQQLQKEARGFREQGNEIRRQLAHAATMKVEKPKDELLAEAKTLKSHLEQVEAQEKDLLEEIDTLALELPNLSSSFTPDGESPLVLNYINEHPELEESLSDRVWRSHVHIGSELDLLDFTGASTTTGWGWYFLKNEAAMLEQALIQYALSVARSYGWTVVSPPSIVYSHIAAACGFQPRDNNDEQQIYALAQADKDKSKPTLSLAATAEIPFAGMKANIVIPEAELPLKVIGASRCYRAEAGARGVDTKGLYRVHEFTKVEMFAWTQPDTEGTEQQFTSNTPHSYSLALFNEMLAIQTQILQSLGLHCRVLEMPAFELGASATRKIDIEAFFPSRRDKDNGWGEVTSASICTDYQARRLNTRIRVRGGDRKFVYPHTVNGTALAVPRVLAAIMEAGWDEETKSMAIPEVLRPWMGGVDKVVRKSSQS